MDAALRLDLADAMARLDPRDRALLALRYAGGLESAGDRAGRGHVRDRRAQPAQARHRAPS